MPSSFGWVIYCSSSDLRFVIETSWKDMHCAGKMNCNLFISRRSKKECGINIDAMYHQRAPILTNLLIAMDVKLPSCCPRPLNSRCIAMEEFMGAMYLDQAV